MRALSFRGALLHPRVFHKMERPQLSDTSDFQDLNDPAVRAELGLGERTEGGVPESTPEQQPTGALRNIRQALDLQTKNAKEATARAEAAERRLAITEAQLPDFPGKGFFLQNYQGEATPDAIRAAATAAGFVLEGAPQQANVTDAELAQHREVANVGAGASANDDIPLEQALLAARTPEEVLAIVNQAPPEAGLRAASTVVG